MVVWSWIQIPDHFPLPSPLRNTGFYDIYYNFSYSQRPIFTTLSEVTGADKIMTVNDLE